MTDKRAAWEGGTCRVPMWVMGCPAGFCDDEAFGEQLPEAILYRERHYNKPYNLVPYCFGPCCPGHGGPRKDEPRIFQDGLTNEGRVMWCAVNPDFINLQESPAGFDGNPFVALANLRAASADTLPKGQDAQQGLAGTESGAVPHVDEADAPNVSRNLSPSNSRKV